MLELGRNYHESGYLLFMEMIIENIQKENRFYLGTMYIICMNNIVNIPRNIKKVQIGQIQSDISKGIEFDKFKILQWRLGISGVKVQIGQMVQHFQRI